MQVAAKCNKGQPVEWLYSTSQDLDLEHRLSDSNKEKLCLPCCARYLTSLALVLTLIPQHSFSNMPSTMSSNSTHSTGLKVSTFLRDEKKSCKQMQKKILSKQDQPV